MGDAHRGQAQLRAEVQRQPGSPRMIVGRRVEQQHVRRSRQRPDRRVHQRTDPQGQQPRTVRRARDAATYLPLEHDAPAHEHSRGPRHVARIPTPDEATREAHPAAADPQLTPSGPPRLRSGPRQLPLDLDQRLRVDRPHVTILARPVSATMGVWSCCA